MLNFSRLSLTIAGVSALALPSCTQMTQFYPDAQVLVIDGEEIAVGPVSGMPGVYRAMPNRPTPNQGFRSDPSSLPKNIQAIEAASGCAVIRDSVQIRSVATLAAVDCTNRSTAGAELKEVTR